MDAAINAATAASPIAVNLDINQFPPPLRTDDEKPSDTATFAIVQALRKNVHDAGLTPIAVKTRSKAPARDKWQDEHLKTLPDAITKEANTKEMSTGILCRGLRAIDIDIDDQALARIIEELAVANLGETVRRYRDESPRVTLLYRAADGAPKKRELKDKDSNDQKHKIEILGDGQLTVIDGIHPDSGLPYRLSKAPLTGFTRDSLPPVSEEQLDAFLLAAAKHIGPTTSLYEEAGIAARKGLAGKSKKQETDLSKSGPFDDLPTTTLKLKMVDACLEAIGKAHPIEIKRGEWLRIAWACCDAEQRGATGAYEKFRTWSRDRIDYDGKSEQDMDNFERDFKPGRIEVGTLIDVATKTPEGRTAVDQIWREGGVNTPTIDKAGEALGLGSLTEAELAKGGEAPTGGWPDPDMRIVVSARRAPPAFPLDVFGPEWATFITNAAKSVSAPVDYVAMPLLVIASNLIGNARWPKLACTGWTEPSHLWGCVVGDIGSSKSPAAAIVLRQILPKLEDRMQAGYPERIAAWETKNEMHKAQIKLWEKKVEKAANDGKEAPLRPNSIPPRPEKPRLTTNDVTKEKVASLISNACPKGLNIEHDEIAGWIGGMNKYSDGDRSFYLQGYNGSSHTVDRIKNLEPIKISHYAISVFGGTQPEKLAEMCEDSADGLYARFLFSWPEPKKYQLNRVNVDTAFAIEALDRVRSLDMVSAVPGEWLKPVYIPLDEACEPILEKFAREMEEEQQFSSGSMRIAYGKARGFALRISMSIEMLRWCAKPSGIPPVLISAESFKTACDLVSKYFMPMAERVYGDAVLPNDERIVIALARYILKNKADSIHVMTIIRDRQIPKIKNAKEIHDAAEVLVEAGWLKKPPKGDQNGRAKQVYAVNPSVFNHKAV